MDYWKDFLTDAGVKQSKIQSYAELFIQHGITIDILSKFTMSDFLTKLKIITVGDVQRIMRRIKELKIESMAAGLFNIEFGKNETASERMDRIAPKVMELALDEALQLIGDPSALLQSDKKCQLPPHLANMSEAFLKHQIERIIQADDYFTKENQEDIARRYITKTEISLLKYKYCNEI